MREQLSFGRAPVDMVLPGGSTLSKTKIKDKLVVEREKKDIDRLRHVAANIRPEVLTAAVSVLQHADIPAVVDLLRGRSTGCPLRTGYFYCVEDVTGKQCARLYRNDSLLASGATAEVFAYAAEEHPGALHIIMNELQSGAQYVPLPKDCSAQVGDMLLAYRICRAKSRGLNEITKLAQLGGIEEDHLCLTFRNASHLDGSEIVVIGSGALGSTHTIFSSPVTLVDPLIPYDGQAYDAQISASWKNINLGKYDAIISDVSLGDRMGMKQDTQFVPEQDFDGMVYTKQDILSNTGPPGRPVRKPRPHNTEVIWEVDWGAIRWEDQVTDMRSKVIEANEARMRNFFAMTGTTKKMPYAYDTDRLDAVFAREYRVPSPLPGRVKQISAPRSRQPGLEGVQKRLIRFELFVKTMQGFTSDDLQSAAKTMNSWCMLPRSAIAEGSANRLDPGIGTVAFAVKSVLLSAIHYGFTPKKTAGGWMLAG